MHEEGHERKVEGRLHGEVPVLTFFSPLNWQYCGVPVISLFQPIDLNNCNRTEDVQYKQLCGIDGLL